MTNMSIRQAADEWISTFEFIPGSLISKLAHNDPAVAGYESDTFRLVASPRIECGHCNALYEGPCSPSDLRGLELSGRAPCSDCGGNAGEQWQMRPPEYAFPCAWGTLFVPRDPSDQHWLGAHRDEVAELGLFVFESEDLGFLLGVDGAGFDFYDALWVPLYELRDLQWHAKAA